MLIFALFNVNTKFCLYTLIDPITFFPKFFVSAWEWLDGMQFDGDDNPFPWNNRRDRNEEYKCLKLDSRGFYAADCSRKASSICAAGLFSCSSNTLGGTLWEVRK